MMAENTQKDESVDVGIDDVVMDQEQQPSSGPTVTLIAKFAKEKVIVEGLSLQTTIGDVKNMIQEKTNILPKRQKLIGLVAKQGGAKGVVDDLPLDGLKIKGKSSGDENEIITHSFILMGTPEERIFIDPQDKDDLPDVMDDFELDFNAGSNEWLQHKANDDNLKKFTAQTECHIMNPPRDGKPLLVLDLDHTLLDFSSKSLQADRAQTSGHGAVVAKMKRPYMDQFLTEAYKHYDMVVWSQTSWRWLETKLIELGMVSNPNYKFCFVLDKTSMFTVTSTRRDGTSIRHHVKPLQLIWTKFPRWNETNTIHIDDLSRNFALNLSCGLKCTAYYRKKNASKRDVELLGISKYLTQLATCKINFTATNFGDWSDVVSGTKTLKPQTTEKESDDKE